MFWTILFYLFLILVFLVFLKLGRMQVGGKKVMSYPMRVSIAVIFPLVFVLVFLFSSIFLLFVMALLLIILLIFMLMFLVGKIDLIFSKPEEENEVVVVRTIRPKTKKRKKLKK